MPYARGTTDETQKLFEAALLKLKADNARLVAALRECLLLIDDFMPNVGHCALQNYQRLNEAPMKARALLKELEG